MVVQSLRKQAPRQPNCVGSTVIYDTSHAWRYMYSASDASKRRSLSICILMVLSAFGPISTVVADHDEGGDGWEEDGPYIQLWIELEGSWQILDPYEMTDLDNGTYDMQIDYIDLDVGSNYTLSWSVYGCLLYTSPSPRDRQKSRMPSSA